MNGETEAEQLGAHPGLNAARVVRPDASNPLMVAETGRMPQCWAPNSPLPPWPGSQSRMINYSRTGRGILKPRSYLPS